MSIQWEKKTVRLNYGLGRYGDKEVCMAQGTDLGWSKMSGTMEDPRDRYVPLHIPTSFQTGPCFFSQSDIEYYIEAILPIANFDEEDHRLTDSDQKRFAAIADSLGYEWVWN